MKPDFIDAASQHVFIPIHPLKAAIKTRAMTRTAITNVKIFDGYRLSGPETVTIDGSYIGEGTHGADIIDGSGCVLLPGLIDAHVHLDGPGNLHQMCQWGVTTALDMACWPASKVDQLRGQRGVTDIRSAGTPVTSSGSLHSHILPLPKDKFLTQVEQAAGFVEDRVAEGSDYIKIIADVPGPSQEIMDAVVVAAHNHRKIVVAHTTSITPFAMAQRAQVDVITHVPMSAKISPADAALMAQANRVAIPTLTMMEGCCKPMSWTGICMMLLQPLTLWSIITTIRQNPDRTTAPTYANARDSVTEMHNAGVTILAGTDANAQEGVPFQVKHGEALHHELELLVGSGLSTVEALRSATILPAQHFQMYDRGEIAIGKRADLVLISGDPIEDIRATRQIRRVWCAGIECARD